MTRKLKSKDDVNTAYLSDKQIFLLLLCIKIILKTVKLLFLKETSVLIFTNIYKILFHFVCNFRDASKKCVIISVKSQHIAIYKKKHKLKKGEQNCHPLVHFLFSQFLLCLHYHLGDFSTYHFEMSYIHVISPHRQLFLTKAKEPCLPCYLTYRWSEKRSIHTFPMYVCTNVKVATSNQSK